MYLKLKWLRIILKLIPYAMNPPPPKKRDQFLFISGYQYTLHSNIFFFFKKRILIYLFLDRGEGKEKYREEHHCVVASWVPLLGTWPAIEACALIGNWTSHPLVCRLTLNPLSHTSQGLIYSVKENILYPLNKQSLFFPIKQFDGILL